MLLGQLAVYIPMAALSAVLVSVAWNMAGIPSVRALLKGQKSDICVLAITFLITVFIDLTVAIEVGLGFAAFFFIKKMIDVSEVQSSRETLVGGITTSSNDELSQIPHGVLIYRIDGPLFFGTVRKFELAIEKAKIDCKAIILQMENMIYLDAGGIKALEQFKSACDRKKITIIISGIHTQPYLLLEKMGTAELIGRENIKPNLDESFARANEL